MIDEALFARLIAVSGVTSLVTDTSLSPAGYRIYPLVIPQHEEGDSTLMPCIVYAKVGAQLTGTLSATDNIVRVTYQIDSYAVTYKAAAQLADQVRAALIDYAGTIASTVIKRITLDNEAAIEDPDPGLYRIFQTYSIWYVES